MIPADKQHAGFFRTRDPELDSGSLSGAKSFCDEVLSQIREILNQVQMTTKLVETVWVEIDDGLVVSQ